MYNSKIKYKHISCVHIECGWNCAAVQYENLTKYWNTTTTTTTTYAIEYANSNEFIKQKLEKINKLCEYFFYKMLKGIVRNSLEPCVFCHMKKIHIYLCIRIEIRKENAGGTKWKERYYVVWCSNKALKFAQGNNLLVCFSKEKPQYKCFFWVFYVFFNAFVCKTC